ncbi:MAG: hypothetical protein AAF067_03260 [Pseudomonadota bacterium]
MSHVFVDLPFDPQREIKPNAKDPVVANNPYAKVYLYDQAGKKKRQVLWGDWLTLAEDSDLAAGQTNSSKWLWVRWAWKNPEKRQLLKVRRAFTKDVRPLEIIFVDVGIGDGCVLMSPERAGPNDDADATNQERIIVIDAGKTEHMRQFLDGRFNAYRDGFHFHAAVITHPDKDHYYGFSKILSNSKIRFDKLYHNGIAEFPTGSKIPGMGGKIEIDGVDYLKELIETDAEMRTAFDPAVQPQGRNYTRTIGKGIAKNNVGSFEMLSTQHGAIEDGKSWMPGFAPGDGRAYTIQILGPWIERPGDGQTSRLRLFAGNAGKTKNGHSIILRLKYGNFSVFFGGDLNRESEKFLLQKYGKADSWPSTKAGRDAMVETAREHLSSDVMKACHHGASDVTDEFLSAVAPAAFVISSGDQDANYVHPRPDLLGRLGKFGSGHAPVLLSTELQRSTRDIDNRELVSKLEKDIEKLVDCDIDAHADPDFSAERQKKLQKLLEKFGSLALPSVAVDGAIYVKTDGNLLITAFKKESQSQTNKWFWYAYRLTAAGSLELLPRD